MAMPNQTPTDATAVDIQADDHETPKAGGQELMATLRLVPVRVLVTDEVGTFCLQEADYHQTLDKIAKDQAQYRAQIALAQSSCAPVLCHLGCCLKSAWRWLSRLVGLSDRAPQ